MLFNSPEFVLAFLPAALLLCFLAGRVGGPRWMLRVIVAASLFFYGWWSPKFVLLLGGSIVANYTLGRLTLRAQGRYWLVTGIAANLALLGWFKYANFMIHDVLRLHAPEFDIFLPLAISFFTFQQIMYLVECHRRECVDAGLLTYAAFIAFFPHLIAGPIVRPREIMPQLLARDLAVPRADHIAEGLTIFLLGLAKKLVLADTFARFSDVGFAAAAQGAPLSFVEAWYAAASYALQIYFDFSGYSDMAIGLARMLNVRFPLNFASPYQAANIADFWRRWHITLSRFLRDYVYIPLGGNRRGELRRNVNLMATMLLGGLWHGAAWNFVLWGGLHGAALVVQHRFRWKLSAAIGRTLTLLFVVIAWVPFRASGMPATIAMLRGMAGCNGFALPQMIVHAFPPLAAIATPVPLLPYLGDARTLSFPEVTACLLLGWTIVLALPSVQELSQRARDWALVGGFAFTVQALFFAPHITPFLYFRF
ncbi:MAG TPA: MBOAT family O-acyltransferase [Acetobacteraceae bacterium]|nr:MBOAT family O-acyltransferase [Acetobacteraceae bacterium]